MSTSTGRHRWVGDWRLCSGCGACVAACPDHCIELVDCPDLGLRPVIAEESCRNCGICLKVCPGISLTRAPFTNESIPQLREAWGPVLEVWEGHATDAQTRYMGSSGGVSTALATYCVEKQGFAGALHIASCTDNPLKNRAVFSRTREDLLKATGSRYAPASPCEKLDWIAQADAPCVFIGKPCDVAAAHKAQGVIPGLREKLGLTLGIFCAGTPTTQGTLALLKAMDADPEQVQELRYRGCGWPGMTTIKLNGHCPRVRELSYEESWGTILCKHQQLPCLWCADATAELADISCGDAWHRRDASDGMGLSLILVRTERGHSILRKAIETGYVKAQRLPPDSLAVSQGALRKKRRTAWGRRLAAKMVLMPTAHLAGFSLFTDWARLPVGDRIRSIVGTWSLLRRRGLLRVSSRRVTGPGENVRPDLRAVLPKPATNG